MVSEILIDGVLNEKELVTNQPKQSRVVVLVCSKVVVYCITKKGSMYISCTYIFYKPQRQIYMGCMGYEKIFWMQPVYRFLICFWKACWKSDLCLCHWTMIYDEDGGFNEGFYGNTPTCKDEWWLNHRILGDDFITVISNFMGLNMNMISTIPDPNNILVQNEWRLLSAHAKKPQPPSKYLLNFWNVMLYDICLKFPLLNQICLCCSLLC